MMRKTMFVVLVGALALSLALPAQATNTGGSPTGKAKKMHVFLGSVTAVSMDEDPATPDTLTFTMIKGNKHARKHVAANPGDVTVSLTQYTHFYGGYAGLHDFRVGDGVKVKARKLSDGTLVAKKARVIPLAFFGNLVSMDAASAVVEVAKANFVGWKYLESHPGSPVTFTLTPETYVGQGEEAPVVGQPVLVKARPSEDGTGLVAMKLLGGLDV